MRLRQFKELTQGYTSKKWQSLVLNSENLILKTSLLTTILHCLSLVGWDNLFKKKIIETNIKTLFKVIVQWLDQNLNEEKLFHEYKKNLKQTLASKTSLWAWGWELESPPILPSLSLSFIPSFLLTFFHNFGLSLNNCIV